MTTSTSVMVLLLPPLLKLSLWLLLLPLLGGADDPFFGARDNPSSRVSLLYLQMAARS